MTATPACKGLLAIAAAAFGGSAFAAPSTSVDFYNLGGFSLVGSSPTGSIGSAASLAYDGSTLYLGQGAGPATSAAPFTFVDDAFGANNIGTSFGSAVGGNGVTGLDVADGILVGVSTNGGANDTLQVFNVATTPTATAAGVVSPGDVGMTRFDAVALDPGFVAGTQGGAGVSAVQFGSGNRRLIDPATGNLLNTGPGYFNGAGGSGFRGLDYDPATGDVYARTVNGIQVGVRSGDNGVQTVGGAAGTSQVVADPSGFAVGLNVAYLGDFGGNADDALFIYNDLSDVTSTSSFDALNLAQQDGAAVAVNFLNADGSAAFAEVLQTSNQTGVFDFSFDPGTGQLAVLDVANAYVYLFDGEPIPEPATAAVVALGGLALLGRRRTA
ncbi:PEP-CTERM sorting domain-containing protein [Phycisphaera mikurensis]|uniref:PEP-CTERM protein-sorting domain-containing protein n=1 Tax=Phycisphaera mikurensis (strain NBRC 102666 / KCTC 22515 / FYK2301M01) TaxID=1142394 RepID=I0IDW9_PHYMF|nr:PEP-CTERM sorting domain-containing protein [Phycisphaera mikurensis]MBB6441264.1 hypothetical protein [Phycisphaera mikurensis]BAM03457.1 hypothetical protein PSMK_12980 [Phycisphaera mikurensis NBRC 102666]